VKTELKKLNELSNEEILAYSLVISIILFVLYVTALHRLI